MLDKRHDLILDLILGIVPWDLSRLRNMLRDISFVAFILSLIFSKQRVPSSVPLLLTEKAPLLVLLVLATLFAWDTLNSKSCSRRAVRLARGQKISVPDHPISRTCGIGESKIFFQPSNFRILQIFKPPFKRLGS